MHTAKYYGSKATYGTGLHKEMMNKLDDNQKLPQSAARTVAVTHDSHILIVVVPTPTKQTRDNARNGHTNHSRCPFTACGVSSTDTPIFSVRNIGGTTIVAAAAITKLIIRETNKIDRNKWKGRGGRGWSPPRLPRRGTPSRPAPKPHARRTM